MNKLTIFQREFPAFSAVFAPFSSIGCISKSRFTGRSDRLLDILKFARLFRIVQRLVCLRMFFFTSPRGPHLVGRGHAQVTCLQFLEKNPLYFSIRSRKCNNPIELSWWFFKTKNWLPIVSGFRIGWAFIFGSCGCSSHTHSDGPKGINHHWTSSKQASSPSSRPLKAMRPQKNNAKERVCPFKNQFYVHQHPQHRQHIWPPHLLFGYPPRISGADQWPQAASDTARHRVAQFPATAPRPGTTAVSQEAPCGLQPQLPSGKLT